MFLAARVILKQTPQNYSNNPKLGDFYNDFTRLGM
jgi:hypothetical protein